MRRLLFLALFPLLLNAAYVEHFKWPKDESFLVFLERNNLPQSIYYDMDKEDQKLAEEIRAGFLCQKLLNDYGEIEQILIPISDELQLHVFQKTQGNYRVEPIPIIYDETRHETLSIEIQSNPSIDIKKATGSYRVASIFSNTFKKSLDFTALQKGDKLVMIYDQKYRFGKPYGMPILQVAMIEIRNKYHYMYLGPDDNYYNEKGAQVDSFLLGSPIPNARISSKFTKRRFHPILKRWRAHLGIDYAARSGTPIRSAGNGRIISAGYSRGYGNVTKIRHSGGYVTLYAHQKSFRRGFKRGKTVKKGQVIGYVGSTGMSSGPHLHFGLYKNGRAINPAGVIKVTTAKLRGKKRREFLQIKKEMDALVAMHLNTITVPEPFEDFDAACYLDAKTLKPLTLAAAKDGNEAL